MTAFANEPGAGLADDTLPAYADMLHAYHRSRAAELRNIIGALPITPGDAVLDVASGDGCYSVWLAERGARVVGADLSPACLERARDHATSMGYGDCVRFDLADAAALPYADETFDLVWCAQSFFSLPNPIAALREMARVTKPGGHIAVLENDTLHHMLLPWPADLELAVRRAQLQSLERGHAGPALDKFYIGRNLCGIFRQCGIASCDLQTVTVERHAPLSADEELFLRLYFADLRERALPYLDCSARVEFDRLFDPQSPGYLLRHPDFHLTHLESLAVGRKAANGHGTETASGF